MLILEQMSRAEKVEEKDAIYVYRLIKDTLLLPFNDEKIEVQSYGIEVERQDLINGVVVGIERDKVKTISPQRYKVRNLMKLLYDNMVSPIHLVDVLGEYVDEYVIDFEDEYLSIATN